MIEHPNTVIPESALPGAYEALVATLARTEPEALARAAAAIQDDASGAEPGGEQTPAASTLARAWIAFSGHLEPVTAPPKAKVYGFAFPAHVAFDMVGTAGKKHALARAKAAVAELLSTDRAVCALQGPFPGHPSVLNLEVWLGTESVNDEVTIEHIE